MNLCTVNTVLNTAYPSSITSNSLFDVILRDSGYLATKVATLNANNTTASVNLFQVTGSVLVRRLYGVLTAKTTLTNCTGAYWDFYDSTAAVVITKNDGVLSGVAVGTTIAKVGLATATFGKNDNAAGAILEPGAAGAAFSHFILTQKTGANSFVRFSYQTTDAPANAQLTCYCEYTPVGQGSSLVSV